MAEADSEILMRVNESGIHRQPSVIEDQTSVDAAVAGTSGVHKQSGEERQRAQERLWCRARACSCSTKSGERRYANTLHIREGSLN